MKLNEKIIYYRRRARYSQQTLADLMGVSRQSVSKWETGESLPEISKLPQLARLFGVTTDHLLSDEEPAGTFPYEEVPEEEERAPGTPARPPRPMLPLQILPPPTSRTKAPLTRLSRICPIFLAN